MSAAVQAPGHGAERHCREIELSIRPQTSVSRRSRLGHADFTHWSSAHHYRVSPYTDIEKDTAELSVGCCQIPPINRLSVPTNHSTCSVGSIWPPAKFSCALVSLRCCEICYRWQQKDRCFLSAMDLTSNMYHFKGNDITMYATINILNGMRNPKISFRLLIKCL